MRATLRAAALLGVTAACSAAHADLRVITLDGDAESNQATVYYDPVTGGYTITLHLLYNQWGDSLYEIHGNAGEVIDSLVIDIDGPPAGSPVIVRVLSEEGTPGISTVHNIEQTGTGETLLNQVIVTEDIGSITVQAIGTLDAGRDIIGPILATNGNAYQRGVTVALAGRDIIGDVRAPQGRVGWLKAQRYVGAPGAPITVEAKHNAWSVVGYDGVWAHINARANGGDGKVYRVLGDEFHGTIECQELGYEPFSGLPARLQFFNQFSGSITIGRSFDNADHWIELPLNGLTGQININADNLLGGVWNGRIQLGPDGHPDQIVLHGPGYPYTAAQLGGGSIGLAPFDLHDESCDPVNGAAISDNTPGDQRAVSLRHYGPVTWPGGTPVVIDRRPAGSSGAFSLVSSLDFQYIHAYEDPNTLVIKPLQGTNGFQPGFEYRILPSEHLRCDVPQQPVVAWDQAYMIEFAEPLCDGDLTGDRVINVTDLRVLLLLWGPATPGMPADLNQDGSVDVLDLLIMLTNWGSCD